MRVPAMGKGQGCLNLPKRPQALSEKDRRVRTLALYARTQIPT